MTTPTDPTTRSVDAAAFRRLLHTGEPATTTQLADDLQQPEATVQAAIDELHRQGQLRLDDDGRILGSAGLSIRPDRHEIHLNGRQFWTWCAYDFFGIFAALDASGHATTVTPDTGQTVRIDFRHGLPDAAEFVLFLPADDPTCSADAYDAWCPHSNLFRSADAARKWAADRGVTGHVLTAAEATERGARAWRPVAGSSR